jgi:hypothetical protein
MSKQEREFLDDLRARSVEATVDMMAGVQRLKTLHDEIAGEDAEVDRVRLSDYLFRLAKLELEHAANILSLGNTQAEMMFDHVRRLVRRSQGGNATRKVLEVRADPGQDVAIGELEIRNPFDREADPRFELTPFRMQDGAPGPDLKIELGCDVVRPYSSALVQIKVHMAAPPDCVLFAELTVYLSAEIEREVARRIVKLKAREPGR